MITCSIFFTKRLRVESPFRSETFKHLSKVRMLLNMFDVHVPLGSVKTSVEELLNKSSELHNNQIMMILITKFQ